jgi:hypothetical protein
VNQIGQGSQIVKGAGIRVVPAKRKIISICYLSAVAVVAVGWLWTISWVTIELAKWVFA